MAPTMPTFGQDEVNLLWTIDTPQLSFTHDIVLSAILGLAATHLLTHNPKNIHLCRSALYYFARTAKQLSVQASRLDAKSAEPVMLVAMIIMAQMRVRAAFIPDHEPYYLPVEYFHIHQGIGTLYLKSLPFLQNKNILITLGVRPVFYETDSLCKETLPSRIWKDSYSLLEGTDNESFDPQVRHIYKRALAYLNTMYLGLIKGEDAEWIYFRQCAMPSNVPKDFVELLKQQDPRAMAILARLIALMKPCDGPRYYNGSAEYEVEGIASLMPSDWLWTMEWPRQILVSDTFWY